jgi:hypothetical protein
MPFSKKEKPVFPPLLCRVIPCLTRNLLKIKIPVSSNHPILQSSNLSNSGQTLIEGLIVCMLVTALMFGLIQVCILVVNDMLYNEVSFSATRAVSVTKEKDIQIFSKKTVNKLLITSGLVSGLLFADIEQDGRNTDKEAKTTNWEGTILGENIVGHDGTNIKKYNVKINYKTRLMFYKLFGGNLFRQQSARARMIKSPDVEYYDKAYPDAKTFSKKQ